MDPLRIAYLLEQTDQTDLVHLALAQADALVLGGHDVRIVTAGLPVTWRSSRAEWVFVESLSDYRPGEGEIVVVENQIAAAGMLVDDEFYRGAHPRDNEPLRVLVAGESQNESSGLRDAYGAAAHARWFHQTFDLVRLSAWVPSREEPLDSVQEFHVGLTTTERRRLLHSCDVLVSGGLREQVTALPVGEALAAGVPCVLTATPVHLSFDGAADFALFAREGNAVELGDQLIELLEKPNLRDRLRARGRDVAEEFRVERASARIEAFFRERRR